MSSIEHDLQKLDTLRGARFHPVPDEDDHPARIQWTVDGAASGDSSLVYLYERSLDHTGHGMGWQTEHWRAALRRIDALARDLREALPDDVRLLVTGDHGMIDSPPERWVVVEDVPHLADDLTLLAGEGRFRQLYCEPRDLDAVAARWRAVMGDRAATGVIAWEEVSEVPLMLVLAVLVVWHVHRREAALTTVTLLADREAAAAAQRVRLARLTSHEMRTPLTIASGYMELILARTAEPEIREELEVAHDELGRLARASDRLLRTIQLADPLEASEVDIDDLLHETATRWSTVAAREWEVAASGGILETSPERIRACLDTLIENALRHTGAGDTVLLWAARTGADLWLAVADSGPGFDADLIAIGARKPGAAEALIFGSAWREIVENVEIPVLLHR